MKIITTQFDYEGGNDYKRLLDVFIYSVKKNMPYCKLEVVRTAPPKRNEIRTDGLVNNTAKLAVWIDVMERTEEDFIFMDCDMLVTGDMSSAWENKFDIAYTTLRQEKININGGVMFIRNNEKSRHFMRQMHEVNDRMYTIPEIHWPYRQKYAGMNQAAFGYMLEHPDECGGCILTPLPAHIYNCCNGEWINYSNETVCIHYKSGLRYAALNQQDTRITAQMKPLADLWKRYEKEMKRKGYESKKSKAIQKNINKTSE